MEKPKKILFFHQNTGKYLGTLDNRGNRRFWGDEHVQDAVDGTNYFNFFMPNTIPLAEKVVGRVRVLIPHEDIGWQEFIVHSSEDDGPDREVRTNGAEIDLNKLKIIESGTDESLTAFQYLQLITTGTIFEPGIVEFQGSRSIDRSRPRGGYDYLGMVGTAFNLEIRIRTQTKGGRITRRFVDLLERVGDDRSLTVEYGKDLVGFRKFVDSHAVVTSLYCQTPEREDGTRLFTTVTHAEAFQEWNWQGTHLTAVYEPESDDQEMTVEELREYGTKALNKLVASIFEYDVEAVSLEHLFQHKKVRLGDRINVKNKDVKPAIYARARVLRVIRSISNPVIKRYIIGEIREQREEDVRKVFKQLQAIYSTRIIKQPNKPPLRKNAIWIQTDPENPSGFEISHTADMELGDWVRTTAIYPFEIGAEPEIPERPTPPNPATTKKWVDTSGEIAELKMWDGATWTAVKGPKGEDGYTPVKGTDYFDGKDGQDGSDGTSTYMWIRYSQNADGSGMVDDPTGANYIGVSTTEISSAPSSPSAYQWSLIKGSDGVPGEPGDDGRTSYLHIKYSNDGGSTFTADSGETVGEWIGTYVDFTQADSASPAAYTWNKVKGERGEPGEDGYTPVIGVDYFDGVDGQDGISSYMWVKYSQYADGSFMTDDPTDARYIGVATTETASAPTANGAYQWTLIRGSDGVPGEPGTDGRSSFLHIKYSNDSGATFTANNGESAGEYIGQYVDFTEQDSSNPADYIWNRVKGDKGDSGERGLQGLQGVQGNQGIPGVKGEDGKTSYTHIAYANSPDGISDFSTGDSEGKSYVGMYTDFNISDSTNPSIYKWTLIKGADGSQGIPGPAGTNGKTPYLHIAYATNSTGTSGFSTTDSVNKTYIGQYTDFVSTDSTTPSKYKWTLIKGATGAIGPIGPQGPKGDQGDRGVQGLQGPQGNIGIQGPKGADGVSSYTHIAYATNSTGTSGFSTSDPTGKTFIGIYVDTLPADSSDPTNYKWTLIKGADGSQGTPGARGADGLTPYFHVAYANNSTGTSGFSTTSSAGKLYIGTYTDHVSADSSDPIKYNWTLIKGDKGDTGNTGSTGPQGPQGPPGNTGAAGPQGEQGTPGFSLNLVHENTEADSQGRIRKTSGSGWVAQAYSQEGYTGGAFLTFRVAQANHSIMVGINTDPEYNASYSSIDYAIYLRSDGSAGVYESGSSQGSTIGGAYLSGDVFAVTYDNENVRYYRNGILFRTVSATPGLTFHFDSSFSSAKSTYQIYDIYFSPMAPRGEKGDKGSAGDRGPAGSTGPQGPNIVDATTTIEHNVIKANHIEVSNLAAIKADLGSIKAGDITGVTMNLAGGKFIVDSSGNVTLSGNLNGAGGTFSGSVVVTGAGANTGATNTMKLENGKLTNTWHSSVYGPPGSMEFGDGIIRAYLGNAGAYQTKHMFLSPDAITLGETTNNYGYTRTVRLDMNTSGDANLSVSNGSIELRSAETIEMFTEGQTNEPTFTFKNVESFRHARVQAGKSSMKFLNGSVVQVQFRDRADSKYVEVVGSAFTTASKREYKKNIESYTENALLGVLNTPARTYHLLEDSDTEMKRVGLIIDEAPVDIISLSGEGIDGYQMETYLWKAIQDLTNLLLDKKVINTDDVKRMRR